MDTTRAESALECWRVALGAARVNNVVPSAHHTAFGMYLSDHLKCEQDMSEEIALVLAVYEPTLIKDHGQLARNAAAMLEVLSFAAGRPLDADGACDVMVRLCAIVPSIGRAAREQARYLRRRHREEMQMKDEMDALIKGRAGKKRGRERRE